MNTLDNLRKAAKRWLKELRELSAPVILDRSSRGMRCKRICDRLTECGSQRRRDGVADLRPNRHPSPAEGEVIWEPL